MISLKSSGTESSIISSMLVSSISPIQSVACGVCRIVFVQLV